MLATRVGYAGGATDHPTYEQVCTDRTGHAEVVEVTYDPSRVDYDTLLNVFWENHDPTTRNRQGPDVGTQYRSVVFYATPEQKAAATASRDALQSSGKLHRPRRDGDRAKRQPAFHPAEEYHQRYLAKRGLASCHI